MYFGVNQILLSKQITGDFFAIKTYEKTDFYSNQSVNKIFLSKRITIDNQNLQSKQTNDN